MTDGVLKKDEAAILRLRSIYQNYGYSRFKMSKFEEYDLYAKNKDFLVSQGVITFMDNDGRLLALKPDVTLSIVKNYVPAKGEVQKVYYNENVYRMSEGTKSFKEIMQTGLECMGDIGEYEIAEVIALAAKSLEAISESYVLDISHLGVISGIVEAAGLEEEERKAVIKCIGEKNQHGIEKICEESSVSPEFAKALMTVVKCYGKCEDVIEKLKSLTIAAKIAEPIFELERIVSLLECFGISEKVNIDFSIVNDMSYYSGIVFRGFIEGIPSGILSGGEYSNLLKKLGKDGGAIGFAVYLGMLERLSEAKSEFDVDTAVLYANGMEKKLIAKIKKLEEEGKSFICLKNLPKELKYKELINLCEREA